MMNLERERMTEVWTRMEKEQKALLDTRDGMTKLMAKGTTELWHLKQPGAEEGLDLQVP